MLALPACAPSVQEAAAPESAAARNWLADVAAIADADASAGRRGAITSRLDMLGIKWRNSPFEIEGQRGTNILADVAGDSAAPLLLLGAHSDQVSKGEGATDNASGSATVLALAERLKARPLVHHRVAIAFWDLEEKGLLGSKAFVADGSVKPALYVNFDVFAWGDTVWMMTPDTDDSLANASRQAASANGLKLTAGEHYPPTDHLAFLKSGLAGGFLLTRRRRRDHGNTGRL
jgi:Zn-dependent M28 family amino/carboxypeptidase